jgi:hypothetical protein
MKKTNKAHYATELHLNQDTVTSASTCRPFPMQGFEQHASRWNGLTPH